MSTPRLPSARNAIQVAPPPTEATSGPHRSVTALVIEATWRALDGAGRGESLLGITVTVPSDGDGACTLAAWRVALQPEDNGASRQTVAAEWSAAARSAHVLRRSDAVHVDVFDEAGVPLVRLSRIGGPQERAVFWAQATLASAIGLCGGQYEVVDVRLCEDGAAS